MLNEHHAEALRIMVEIMRLQQPHEVTPPLALEPITHVRGGVVIPRGQRVQSLAELTNPD